MKIAFLGPLTRGNTSITLFARKIATEMEKQCAKDFEIEPVLDVSKVLAILIAEEPVYDLVIIDMVAWPSTETVSVRTVPVLALTNTRNDTQVAEMNGFEHIPLPTDVDGVSDTLVPTIMKIIEGLEPRQ